MQPLPSFGGVGGGFPFLPRLAFCDVTVANTSQIHSLELGITELKLVEQGLYLLLHILEFLKGLLVNVKQLATGRNHTVPVFLGQLQGTIHEVAINSHQLVVDAILEIFPSEVVILGLRGIGCQHIAQHILLARHVNQILVQPDSPVARGRDLVVLQVQELVGRYVVRHDILAMSLHHDGEDDAVEHDVVLSDEMD